MLPRIISGRAASIAVAALLSAGSSLAQELPLTGASGYDVFYATSPTGTSQLLAVNLTGTFHCLQAAVPDMLEARWGRMVTISSSSAQSGSAHMAHYVAAKAGVVGLTRALALEFARKGITVNCIPPGMIDTPMLRRAEADGDVANLEQLASMVIPVRRLGTPEEIAATCGFLCSDEAAYVTGQVIAVNGGMVLCDTGGMVL